MQASPGRGASRGRGSSGRRRRGGDRPVGRVRRLAERGFKRAATAGGAGRRVHRPGPRPPGGLIPVCPVRGEGRAQVGAPCAPREHPDCIYQRVVSPQAPIAPSPITQSGRGGSFLQGKSDISPPCRPCPGSGPLLCGLAGGSNPRSPARSERFGPDGGRSGPGCAPGNHRGALAVRRAPHPTITLRIHPGQGGAAVSRAAGNGARGDAGTANPPPRPTPTALRPALPHPTDRPVPLPALAARLDLGPVGRRAGPTGRCPLPPSPPV